MESVGPLRSARVRSQPNGSDRYRPGPRLRGNDRVPPQRRRTRQDSVRLLPAGRGCLQPASAGGGPTRVCDDAVASRRPRPPPKTRLRPASDLAPPGRWAPEFLFAWSYNPAITIEQQLDAMSRLPGGQIRDDLRGTWKDGSVPPNLQGLLEDEEALPGRVSDLIFDYWQVAIAPYWQRIRSVIDDDVAYRGAKAFTDGIFSMFTDLHPEITLVDRVLKIDKPHHRDASYQGTQITLLPSVFIWPNLIIGHEAPDEFSLIYAARGVGRVWEGLPSTANPMGDLDSLIGRTRAAILRRLDVPMTTTQVARDLHQSPSTVSEHLTVLRGNGLLISWRAGRGVLYRRTPLASSLMAASEAQGKSGQTSAPA